MRLFDATLLLWFAPLPELHSDRGRVRPVGETALPMGDGSDQWWSVIDTKTGASMWLIEAGDFDTALAEKKRLCRVAGAKPGWTYLAEV